MRSGPRGGLPRSSRRLLLVSALLVAALAVVVATERGRDGDREEIAAVVDGAARAAGGGTATADGGNVCAALSERSARLLAELAATVGGVEGRRPCAEAILLPAWRAKPLASVRTPVRAQEIAVRGTEAIVAGTPGAAPLRVVRERRGWKVDLAADPVWRYRVAVSRACAAGGRELGSMPPPRPTRRAFAAELRRQAAALGRMRHGLAERTPPRSLRRAARRLERELRTWQRRMLAAAARIGRPGARLPDGGPDAAGGRWDPVSNLPVPLARSFGALVRQCWAGSSAAVADDGNAEASRRCTRAAGRLARLPAPTSPGQAFSYVDRARRGLEAVARETFPVTTVAPEQGAVAAALRQRFEDASRTFDRIGDAAAALDPAAVQAQTERLQLVSASLDQGLRQLGIRCAMVAATGGT